MKREQLSPVDLRFYLLGPLRVERDSVPIHLPRRKVESLLAYLLLNPEKHSRDSLATLFWGDSPDEQARQSLRTALATVRRLVSPELLYADRDFAQLNSALPIWIDLHQLLALEDSYNQTNMDFLQRKLELWQGELLAGFYDEWVTSAREHYRARLLNTFLKVVQGLRASSEYGRAIEVANRLLTFDPSNEHAHQHLMFCYLASGQRAAALRQYELCVRALQDDLDAPPMAETTALYQWIKQYDGGEQFSAAKITNLPIPPTSFIGRNRESAEIKRLLLPLEVNSGVREGERSPALRLLTLTGAGGTGKTRLSIQVATDLIDSFEDGVWWVELAGLGDGGLVVAAVAKALGVREVPETPHLQSVTDFVGDKQILLVLDNCEHLIDSCAQLAAELLRHCPNMHLLATSREPLNVAGEALWNVPTFSVPDPTKLGLVELLLQFESVRLFVERAALVQPGFELTVENAHAVVQTCHQLDGIPLAIELAAARTKVLTVEQIADNLTRALGARFELLTQGHRDVLPRQQTLRATLDWSYDLLDDAERLLFRQLSVFRGGFTLEALQQIQESTLTPMSQSKVVDGLNILTQLVDKSLVIVEPQEAQRRYRLLETLREYALEHFTSPAELRAVQQRHADYFVCLAEQAAPELIGKQQSAWLKRLEAELSNLRAALDFLMANGDIERALRLTAAIFRFWDVLGYASEGREWLRKGLGHRDKVTALTHAKALNAAGCLAARQGDNEEAGRLLAEGLVLFEQVEDELGVAEALQNLAVIEMDFGDYAKAEQRLEQSLRLCRALNYEHGVGRALSFLGGLAWDQDRFVDARDYFQESLRIYQLQGDQVNIANRYLNIGDTERLLGNLDAARMNYEECLKMARNLGHKGLIGASLKSLGMAAHKQHDYAEARRYGEEALHIFRELGDKSHIGFALSNLGDVSRSLGDNRVALSYFCQSLQVMYEVGYKWPIFYALEDIARLFLEVGQHTESAVRFLSAAHLLREETDIPVPENERGDYKQRLNDLRGQVGEGRFQTLWDEGQSTSLDILVVQAGSLLLT